MAGRIPQGFIDEVTARADIAELIGSRVQLKRAGREFKGLCPFHGEKTPSFTVSPEKGFYHCFGCGAHGTAIGFLMQHDNLSFVEAVEALADQLGLEVPRETGSAPRERYGEIYAVLAEAEQLFRRQLKDTPAAVDYLKSRAIDGTTAARFGMGYALDSWDGIKKLLGNSPQAESTLLAAGLLSESESGRRYDRFRGRLMFPIRDPKGRVIGFGGRIIGDGEPKYLNSPETPVFHKGQGLYGLYEARQSSSNLDRLLVVEGYMDVASLAQFGIGYSVATLGTATTKEQVLRLSRAASHIVFCFDGDAAGKRAAWRALETTLPHARGVVEYSFLFLPQGEDPDSLVRREGPKALEDRIDEAQPLGEFLVEGLAQRVEGDSVDGRARLAELARPLLGRVPAGIYKDLLVEALADRIGLGASIVAKRLGADVATPPAAVTPTSIGRSNLVRQAVAMVLHYPQIGHSAQQPEGLVEANQPGLGLLRALLETVAHEPHITSGGLVERFREHPEGQHLSKLLTQPPQDDAGAAPSVFADCLARIVAEWDRHRLSDLTRQGLASPEDRAEYERIQERLKGEN